MPITDILERNCRLYGEDICLVEINPEIKENTCDRFRESSSERMPDHLYECIKKEVSGRRI